MTKAPRVSEAPKVVAAIIDFACARDRTFFAGHPGLLVRERQYIPGELWPFDAHVDKALRDDLKRRGVELRVRVTIVAPGVRVREALFDVNALEVRGQGREAARFGVPRGMRREGTTP